MRTAHRALAPPLRASVERASSLSIVTRRNLRSESTATSTRRQAEEEESNNDQAKDHAQAEQNGVKSKAITISAVEELQASNRILRDELRKHKITIPRAASVLEASSKRHLEMAVTESKLLGVRHHVQELLKAAREDDGEVLEAYCESNTEELKEVMGGR